MSKVIIVLAGVSLLVMDGAFGESAAQDRATAPSISKTLTYKHLGIFKNAEPKASRNTPRKSGGDAYMGYDLAKARKP